MSLNPEQSAIFSQVLEGKHILVTGPAGTGKSFLIDHICKAFDKKGYIYRVLAPTGVAAVNVNGHTIHRFLSIRPDIKIIEDYKRICARRSRVPWYPLKAIIIDEVSMIHPNLFVLFDEICRFHKRRDLPFGGIQMIFLGDFFQLAPVPESNTSRLRPAEYIFETDLWAQMNVKVSVLGQIMRQNELDFIVALNDLRVGKYTDAVESLIAECSENSMIPDKHYVRIFSLNVDKDYHNESELDKLVTPEVVFNAKDVGDDRLLKDLRAPKVLKLKTGCPVMLLWNQPEDGLCNGSIGIVQSVSQYGNPVVKFNSGQIVTIHPKIWARSEKTPHGTKILASRTQYPLTLAYSIVAHKSQSLTIDHLVVDCRGVFAFGQLYVMFSRAASRKGLIIVNFNKKAIMANEKIQEFYKEHT